MSRTALRKPAAYSERKPRLAKPANFPAPTGGWIRNQNLATPGARMPDGTKVNGAYVLENWFPTATGIRMRRGSLDYATIGNGLLDTVSMFSYVNGNNAKLFAATIAALYDITGGGSVSAAAVDNLNSGFWSAVQFATPGGVFLRTVNGVDTPLVFNGSSWSTSPGITGVDSRALSYTWSHQRRIFFIKQDSLSAYYLPADSIGGAAVELPLGGVFSRGGSLLFGSSWSLETGGGLSEQCAFVTTEGEVAIFQGTDPGSVNTWQKVGVYRIGKPLGAKAHIRAGGDLVIATDVGFVPLSAAIQRDYSALSPSAVSYPIETAWNDAVATRSARPWACEVWPTKQMVLVAPPTIDEPPQMFAANARTGAWAPYTGWNGTCLQLFGDRMFFGSMGGKIVEAEVTGTDNGVPYTSVCIPQFDALKTPLNLKTSLLMRATIKAPSPVLPRLSLQSDFTVNLPAAPAPAVISEAGVWGGAVWDESTWGESEEPNTYREWQSVGGSGCSIAPGIQITSGSLAPADVELVQVEMTYDLGDIVT
jgi:hypothetical protein